MSFRTVLADLVAQRCVGVKLAIFCDEDGERVEAVARDPRADLFDVDLCGASYAAVVGRCNVAGLCDSDSSLLRMRVLHDDEVLWLRGVAPGYYLVVVAGHEGRSALLEPILDEVGAALREHM